MLETEIKKLTEAVTALTAVLTETNAVPTQETTPEKAPTPAKSPKPKATTTPAPEPEAEETSDEVGVGEVRERLRAVLTKCGPDKAKAVLAAHGKATSITTLAEEHYASVVSELDDLLAAAELEE